MLTRRGGEPRPPSQPERELQCIAAPQVRILGIMIKESLLSFSQLQLQYGMFLNMINYDFMSVRSAFGETRNAMIRKLQSHIKMRHPAERAT